MRWRSLFDEPPPPIMEARVRRHRARPARARWSRARGRYAAEGAGAEGGLSTGPASMSARMPASAAARRSAVLTDPHRDHRTGNVFGGMIGGVQAGYNYRLRSGLLFGVEADFSFPNYFTSNSIVSIARDTRAPTSPSSGTTSATARGRVGYAAGPWLVYATGGFALAGERFVNTPAVGDEEKMLNTRLGWIAGARHRIRFRAALERAAGISLQPVRRCQRHLSVGHAIRLDAGFPVAPRRPQPQDRLAGRAQLTSRRPR